MWTGFFFVRLRRSCGVSAQPFFERAKMSDGVEPIVGNHAQEETP
jgi:hypothetical protein